MLNTFLASFKISFIQNANSFIFFLKRIPLFGKFFPEKLYKATGLKVFFAILSTVFKIIGGLFKTLLYFGIILILPAFVISRYSDNFYGVFLNIFFFMSFVLSVFMNSSIFNFNNKEAYDMINLMRCDAKEYFIIFMLYEKFLVFIYSILPMIIIGSIFNRPISQTLLILIEIIILKFFGEAVQVLFFEKKGNVIAKNSKIILPAIIGCLLFAYGLPLLKFILNLEIILTNIFIQAAILIIGCFSIIYLFTYRRYKNIARTVLVKDGIFNSEAFSASVTFATVELDEKKLGKDLLDTSKFNNKKGYDYLDSIFFYRHRKMIINPIKYRVLVILAVTLFFIALSIFFPSSKLAMIEIIGRSQPLMVFIMYSISTGERVCKAMFHNCDVSLLSYKFYRDSKSILSNFTYRANVIILLNLIPAVTLIFALIILIFLCNHNQDIVSMVPFFLSILCLSCFFSIHHLLMYYVLQPYTSELTVKSPLFRISNGIIYFISYFCLNLKTSTANFTLGILFVTIIYSIIALVLIYKLSPKTFKLR
ncbi:hypothetical protein [Clostridium folliculivorans]|uniref:Uncharacterized protein n=1 Tax=Clostridium folliculivorans TaxID=2886038 RepID=A0A9W5Y195_9CLOT|nr:hypothetical protein [Clostridium folliculivorans]GKU24695.1 hypothetical protein CFOLD11_15210 [Clostridium folliculivorans]GKU30793.1 hypothetical protein CFB3_29000 [Clostridium folliculivorans]